MEHLTTDDIRAAFAAEVRGELSARKISGTEAARLTGISYQTLRRYLDGSRDFPVPALYKIANAIGADPSALVARSLERMSPRGSNVTPLQPRQNFTAAELDAMSIDKAANNDKEVTEGSPDPD